MEDKRSVFYGKPRNVPERQSRSVWRRQKRFPKAPLFCFISCLPNWDPTGPREGSVSPRVHERNLKCSMDERSARTRRFLLGTDAAHRNGLNQGSGVGNFPQSSLSDPAGWASLGDVTRIKARGNSAACRLSQELQRDHPVPSGGGGGGSALADGAFSNFPHVQD